MSMDNKDNPHLAVGAVVLRGGDVLMVRHTYGGAKGKYLIPGGMVERGELPDAAVLREVREETGVEAEIEGVLWTRCRPDNWYMVFQLRFVAGEPRSDGKENDSARWMTLEEAISREDVTPFTARMLAEVARGVALTPYRALEDARGEYLMMGGDGQ